MQDLIRFGMAAALAAGLGSALLVSALSGQEAAPKEAPVNKGMPPRATPGDYQAHTQIGPVTLAGEFAGHSVPTASAVYKNENYITVEVGLFGAADAHTTISSHDFSLRINENKKTLPSQPEAMMFDNLMDPEWEPPEGSDSKSKTSLGAGDQKDPNATPVTPKPPFPLKRGWQQNVLKATLPEGDRQLPVAGLLFFRYGGKDKGIYAVTLVYSGAAGKAELELHP